MATKAEQARSDAQRTHGAGRHKSHVSKKKPKKATWSGRAFVLRRSNLRFGSSRSISRSRGGGFDLSDFRSHRQCSDFDSGGSGFRHAGFRFDWNDCGFDFADFRFESSDLRFDLAGCGSNLAGFRVDVAGFVIFFAGFRFGSSGCGFGSSGCGFVSGGCCFSSRRSGSGAGQSVGNRDECHCPRSKRRNHESKRCGRSNE